MTASPAIGSLSASDQAMPARAHQRHADGFDRQLQSAGAQMAQSATAADSGAGSLLSSDLLRQIQSLTGLAAATPPL